MTFDIAVTNNGPDPISNVQVQDVWPATTCLTPDSQRTATLPLNMTIMNNPYTWALATTNGVLNVGQTFHLSLIGHIANNASCVWSYNNISNLQYTINGQTKTAQSNATINATYTPSSVMNFTKRVISYGENVGDPVVFALDYVNNGSAIINNYSIIDYLPGTLSFSSSTPMPFVQSPVAGGQTLQWFFTTPLAP